MVLLLLLANFFFRADAGVLDSSNPLLYLGLNQEMRCSHTCLSVGPPPDSILDIPPPPIPSLLLESLVLRNHSQQGCNLCHIFSPQYQENGYFYSQTVRLPDSWQSFLMIIGIGLLTLCTLIFVIVARLKNWKIFPMNDSCPLLPDSKKNLPKPSLSPQERPSSKVWPDPPTEGIYHNCDESPEYTELDYETAQLPWQLKAYDNEAFLSSEFAKNLIFASQQQPMMGTRNLEKVVVRLQSAPHGYTVANHVASMGKRPLPPLPGKFI